MLKQVVAREFIERAGDIREAFSVDNIIDALDAKLYLTAEQRDNIRPVVADLRGALIALVERWREQGYVDSDAVVQTMAPVLADTRERLKPLLDTGQYQDLDAQMSRLADNGVEIARHLVMLQIATRLELTPEQVREIRPILHEYLVRISSLLEEAVQNPDWSAEYLLAVFENYGDELRSRLRDRLEPEQLRRIMQVQQELRARLRDELQTK
jgi:hypothetical protein